MHSPLGPLPVNIYVSDFEHSGVACKAYRWMKPLPQIRKNKGCRAPYYFHGCSWAGSNLAGRVGWSHLTRPDPTRPDRSVRRLRILLDPTRPNPTRISFLRPPDRTRIFFYDALTRSAGRFMTGEQPCLFSPMWSSSLLLEELYFNDYGLVDLSDGVYRRGFLS